MTPSFRGFAIEPIDPPADSSIVEGVTTSYPQNYPQSLRFGVYELSQDSHAFLRLLSGCSTALSGFVRVLSEFMSMRVSYASGKGLNRAR